LYNASWSKICYSLTSIFIIIILLLFIIYSPYCHSHLFNIIKLLLTCTGLPPQQQRHQLQSTPSISNIWNWDYDRCICVSCSAFCQLITITCQRPLSRHKLRSVKFTVFQTTLSTDQKKSVIFNTKNLNYLLVSFIKSWRVR